MTKSDCIDTLRALIERSDRNELAEAQAAIIQFALGSPDLKRRTEAMADLQTALETEMLATKLAPDQAAYYAVVEAMIDRTRDAVVNYVSPAATA